MEATHYCSAEEVARILRTTASHVLHLARLGGVTPEPDGAGSPAFTFQQLLLLRTTQGLLDAGVPPRRVQRVWASLRRQLRPDLPLTSIRILADGHRAIAWDGAARWQPESGQFLLDFDAGEMAGAAAAAPGRALEPAPPDPAGVIARGAAGRSGPCEARPTKEQPPLAVLEVEPPAAPSRLSAEQWFHIASELEAESPLEAHAAYRQALEIDPDMADAHLNLGRLEHEAGELGKAEAHYREAVRDAPDDATCHFNLGVLLEDRGRPDEAILAYRQAIARDPDAGDAHYNLGLLLESRGRRAEAIRHLMTARRLYAEAARGS